MQREQSLPINEQVEEVRARSEDRVADIVVPALENLAAQLSRQAMALRERFTRARGA